MGDEPLTVARLRIVADNDGLDPERFRLKTAPPGKPSRMKHSSVPFARVLLPWLTDRRFDGIYQPPVRLWLLLLIKTREGRIQVRLTNEMAAEIGLSRHAKLRALACLEEARLVSVTHFGKAAPLVQVCGRCNT
jgi:hypothetical protein